MRSGASTTMSSLSFSSSSPSILRQRRRNIILQHQHHEEKVSRQQQQHIVKGQNEASDMFAKFYLAVLLVLAMTVIVLLVLFYSKSLFFAKKPKPQQQERILTIMSLYPPEISPKHDFDKQRFFRNWVFATPENKPTRIAIQNMLSLGKALKRVLAKKGHTKLVLQTWEQQDMDTYVQQQQDSSSSCDVISNFDAIYHKASNGDSIVSQTIQFDLVLWCLLASGRIDGHVPYDYSKIISRQGTAALSKIYKQKKLYERQPQHLAVLIKNDDNDNESRIMSDSLILFPATRTEKDCHNKTNRVAKRVLDWIVRAVQEESMFLYNDGDASTYRHELDRFLYQISQQKPDEWFFLHAACHEDNVAASRQALSSLEEPNRQLWASHCRHEKECCNIHVPEVDISEQGREPLNVEKATDRNHGSELRH